MEFRAFSKIARWSREIIITEKIDGTNGLVAIQDARAQEPQGSFVAAVGDLLIYAGSRARWLLPEKTKDNFGFAAWVKDNAEELAKLGPGFHYGEWWGAGIQRGYGLTEKRFSLFNVSRWDSQSTPSCCRVVPVLYRGLLADGVVDASVERLRADGSVVAPGFKTPEGVVVFHVASGALFKKTLDGDGHPKSRVVLAPA